MLFRSACSHARLKAARIKKSGVSFNKVPTGDNERLTIEALRKAMEKNNQNITETSDEVNVTMNDITDVISLWTGIPVCQVTKEESQKLLEIESELHKRVVGQEEAVTAVSTAVRRGRAGLKDDKRPVGSFLFLGPTGVGKTELSKALAECLFDTEDNLIRLDMSEFMERHSVSKIIGSPPGYVGFDDGGQIGRASCRERVLRLV